MTLNLPLRLLGTAPNGNIPLVASAPITQCQRRGTNHTLSEEGSVMHSVLNSQPHENAVLIQLDEHYSVRSSPPRDREQKSPRGLVGTPILHPVGSMLKSKSLRVLNIGYLRGHMQTSCGRKRMFSSQRQTGCLWLTLVLCHSKADCILPPHRLHPPPHRKEHYNSFATEFDSYDSLPSPERAIGFQKGSTRNRSLLVSHTATWLVLLSNEA